jgi:CRISPR-associated protein Cmr6
MAELYPLPQDTLEAFKLAQARCWNLGLLFERYTGFTDGWLLEGKAKYGVFSDLAEKAKRAKSDSGYRDLLQQYHHRWQEAIKTAGAVDDCIFEASPEWRLAVGLGRENALETGFTFHRLYGFPYIPGSALKGLTQAWALWQVAERLGVPGLPPGTRRPGPTPVQQLEALLMEPDTDGRKSLLDKLRQDDEVPAAAHIKTGATDELLAELKNHAESYQAIFGTQQSRGRIVFFDAVPVEPPTLAVDVMNPHYGDYYQKKPGVPPADYLSPVPVYFLTVQADSRFAFAVASHEAGLARLACGRLKEALANLGAGAKTSAGYGYFELSRPTAIQSPTTQAVQIKAERPVVQPPSAQRHSSHGQVRYDIGKVYIADANEPDLRVPVDWKALGMDALAGKTPVEYEYEDLPSGKRKVVKVTSTLGPKSPQGLATRATRENTLGSIQPKCTRSKG